MSTYLNFIKAHEKLIALVLVLLVGAHLYEDGLKAWVNHKTQAETTQQQVVNKDTTDNAALLAQVSSMQSQLNQQTIALNKSISNRDKAAQVEQKVDSTLPMPELAKRWASLLSLESSDFIPDGKGNTTVTTTGSRATVEALETLKPTQQDLADTRKMLSTEIDLASKQEDTLTGLQKENKDTAVLNQQQLTTATAKAKEEKFSAIKTTVEIAGGIGLILGFMLGHK